MKIIAVNTIGERAVFLSVASFIYRNDSKWIRPLDRDIEAVFDEKTNQYFEHGLAARWILASKTGQIIGRIAAFINYQNSHSFDVPTGGIGFFECIQDQKAAFKLLDTAREWLRNRGMRGMIGPINFGENNSWWGLVTDGFERPLFRHNYNPAYYQDFFKAYGFEVYYHQFYLRKKISDGLPERFRSWVSRYQNHPDFKYQIFDKKRWEEQALDFCNIYNQAWKSHANFTPQTPQRARQLFKAFAPILEERLIVFIYHKNNPIGCLGLLPDLNQIVAKIKNGRMGLIEKLKFAYYRQKNICNRAIGFMLGVIPEYQGRGLEAYLLGCLQKELANLPNYQTIELGWVGDFHPKAMNLYRHLGFKKVQTSVTMKRNF